MKKRMSSRTSSEMMVEKGDPSSVDPWPGHHRRLHLRGDRREDHHRLVRRDHLHLVRRNRLVRRDRHHFHQVRRDLHHRHLVRRDLHHHHHREDRRREVPCVRDGWVAAVAGVQNVGECYHLCAFYALVVCRDV